MGTWRVCSTAEDEADEGTAFFFGLPFGIAGMIRHHVVCSVIADQTSSVANKEEPLGWLRDRMARGELAQRWLQWAAESYTISIEGRLYIHSQS